MAETADHARRRLPGPTPNLHPVEALEVTAVHSVVGAMPPDVPLITRPSLLHPHHSAIVVRGSQAIGRARSAWRRLVYGPCTRPCIRKCGA
jgi:hypothetical protein